MLQTAPRDEDFRTALSARNGLIEIVYIDAAVKDSRPSSILTAATKNVPSTAKSAARRAVLSPLGQRQHHRLDLPNGTRVEFDSTGRRVALGRIDSLAARSRSTIRSLPLSHAAAQRYA